MHPSEPATSIRLPVAGMTCGRCVAAVRDALEAVPGVTSARVDLAARGAEVEGPGADRQALIDAIEGAGYRVADEPPGVPSPQLVAIGPLPPKRTQQASPVVAPVEWNFAVRGMHCASCVGRVESALRGVPGVAEPRVNLATERLAVRVDPGVATEGAILCATWFSGWLNGVIAEITPRSGSRSV